MTVDHIKQGFCTSPAWNDQWPAVEAMLYSSHFKEFAGEERFKEHITDPSERVKFTTQLELGILGLLLCTDS